MTPARLTIDWHGEQIVDVPPKTVAHEGPVYERPYARPTYLDQLQADDPAPNDSPRPSTPVRAARRPCCAWSPRPNLASKSWVTDQYDRYVLGNTVLAQPEDSGVVRIADDGTGVAVSTDGNGRWCKLDPYAGAQLALAEAYRNVATTGAKPLAVTNCLNFGSPEDTRRHVAVRRNGSRSGRRLPRAGCTRHRWKRQLLQPDRRRRDPADPGDRCAGCHRRCRATNGMTYGADGEAIWLIGETARRVCRVGVGARRSRHLGGLPPMVDLTRERKVAEILVAASRDGLVDRRARCLFGRLGVTLVEMALRSGTGARVVLPEAVDPFVALFRSRRGGSCVVVPRS